VDLMTLSIRIAGFEIRESIFWTFGSGFPKSLDVSKAIDKAAGAARAAVGERVYAGGRVRRSNGTDLGALNDDGWKPTDGRAITAPATPDARRWQGWGTALKPAHEPIVVARKPFPGTVAGNVLAHGTGALNIDACRTVAGQDYRDKCASVVGLDSNRNGDAYGEWTGTRADSAHTAGRWPTNVLLTHQPLLDDTGNVIGDACADRCVPGCPVTEMDAQSVGTRAAKPSKTGRAGQSGGAIYGGGKGLVRGAPVMSRDDEGGASRFFPTFRYQAKAPKSERPRLADGTTHNTVKPLALMRWLTRLITPAGGTVLDPFLGSGTTAEACVVEGFRCVGVELEEDHLELTRVRLSKPIMATFGEAS
jgi:site-specific DNA-methyltransferase (adenine-specific)